MELPSPEKNLRLSLERPWKDGSGRLLPVLYDVTPEGEQIYEPTRTAGEILSENLQRIFQERGIDFFDKFSEDSIPQAVAVEADLQDKVDSTDTPSQTMSADDLFKMRAESLPHIYTALGEIDLAVQLTTSLLNASPQSAQQQQQQQQQSVIPNLLQQLTAPSQLQATPSAFEAPPASSNFSATVVRKQPPIPSVAAFNAQLNLGAKDQSLRKAAAIFNNAAKGMEASMIKNQKYWLDALKLRRANWGLVPAPFPPNIAATASGKGRDKLSKDFLVSFGLEESPPIFKQRAVAQMPDYAESDHLNFRSRSNMRLRVSIITKDLATGETVLSQNSVESSPQNTLEETLRNAQREIVDDEIFASLVREAGSLPTASTRVSERLVWIEVTETFELRFDLSADDLISQPESHGPLGDQCQLIYHCLHALLLRLHSSQKQSRLGLLETNQHRHTSAEPSFQILQSITDLLQYQDFCQRVLKELQSTMDTLKLAGISCTLRFQPVGELGKEVVGLIDQQRKSLGGEAILRVDNRHTLRFTLSSPSTLIVHLPQATMTIGSIPLLTQLLSDEVELCLLRRICDIGSDLCDGIEGTWFVDLNQCVGRWDGCVL